MPDIGSLSAWGIPLVLLVLIAFLFYRLNSHISSDATKDHGSARNIFTLT